MIQEPYGMTVTTDMSVDEAEAAVREALSAEGFGVLTEINVAATFAAKLGIEYPAYKILGACNPVLAHRALGADDRIGLLLPCNVIVAESDDGTTVVSALDPGVMERVADNEEIAAVATDARARLERVLQTIS